MDAMRQIVGSDEMWARALRAVVLFIAFWLGAHLCAAAIRLLARRRGVVVEKRSLVGLSLGPLRALVQVLALYYAVLELGLTGRPERFVSGALYVLAVLVGFWTAVRLTGLSVDAYLSHLADASRGHVERDYVPLVRKASAVLIGAMGTIIAFHHFGIEVTAIITTLGVGGLAVGFAAKETLSNMIAGFSLLVDRPFRSGDRIKLATGESGDVLEIGIRSTRIRLLDHNLLVVPNAELTNSRIVNCNYPTSLGQGTVEIRLPYGADVARFEELVRAVLRADAQILADPKTTVLLRRFGDSGLEIAATFTVAQFGDVAAAEDRVRRELYRRLLGDQVGPALPQLEVRVVERR